jgi:hypothetical protein
MIIEQSVRDETYTPITFLENARNCGFKVAWDLDKAFTAERNPNLARVHRTGMALANEATRSLKERTRNEGFLMGVTSAMSQMIVAPIGYFVGTICGVFDVKPEQVYNQLNSEETQ